MRYHQIISEKHERWMLKQDIVGSVPKEYDVLVNPGKNEIKSALTRYPADDIGLRGCYFPSDGLFVLGSAFGITHIMFEDFLDRHDEAHDTGADEPYSGRFYVSRGPDGAVIFIGNPDVVFSDPRARKMFDRIDLPTGAETEYEPSQWGVPAREWSHLVG